MTLLYNKVETNAVADDFSWLPTVHHAHKLADTTMEEYTCKILCLDSLLVSDNANCFYLDIKEISFPLAPKIVEE